MLRCIAVFLFTALGLSAAAFAQTNFPVQLENNVSLVGSLNHPALIESSGLTASKQHPGVLWTHNDGGEHFIFAINRRGEHLGAFEVQGASLIDWEAISADDHGNLYLADIGTNGLARTHSAIHRVEEPEPADEWGPAEVEQTWLIRFPGEREDCESFFVLDGYGYLVTKYPRGRALSIYRFLLGSSSEYILELVARIPRLATVSDAALSPDKQRLAFVTNEGVDVYFIDGDPANISSGAHADTEFDEPDMEGITFVPDGLLVTFDQRRDVLLFDSVQLTGAPEITEPLQDRTAFVGSDVTFEVQATGFPALSYTWIFNGGLLRGQTSPQLVLTNVTLADAGLYEVIVSNARGTARSSATLTVLERTVDVRITEVMSSEAPGNVAKADWWELTSFDTQPVNLGGWRFNDSTGGITNGFRIPDGTIIQPGESIVFVEDLTAGQFRAWWGTNNLSGVQIITYSGTQLSFNAVLDTLRLWTNETTDEDAPYAEETFGPADVGVTFGYDPVTEEFGEKSQVGVNGAYVAAAGSDIGSPGRIRNVLVPTVNLRVTEVMSSEVLGTIPKADWWELTSFDTAPVVLGGWRFNDSTGGLIDAFIIPSGVTINPGESIIFVEDLTPAEFIAWWGANNVAPGTQIITYSGIELSFSSDEDSLRLWTAEATNDGDIYTQVNFGLADTGVSFGYDPATGQFGEKSQVGVNGAFVAGGGPEIGSPGRIANPPVDIIDLRITEVMSSEAPGGVPKADWWELTSFDTEPVDLSGWRFNDNAGGLSNSFVIPNGVTIQPGAAIIFVEDLSPAQFTSWWGADNIAPGTQIITYTGIELSFSSDGDSVRVWTADAEESSEPFLQVSFGLADLGVSFGYDPATGQFGEKSRVGVNGALLAAAGPEIGSPGRIRNVPVDIIDLRITEVMSLPATGTSETADWWELTSFHNEPVDLGGWMFNDNTGGFSDAFVIPGGVSVQPGESIIFVEDLSRDAFLTWWGPGNFSPSIQVITYTGIELSFNAGGDSLRLWTVGTTDTNATFRRVDFGVAEEGVTFGYDPFAQVFGEKSQPGVHGAFVAATGPDVGSPGRIRGAEEVQLQLTAQGVRIDINAPGENTYSVEVSDDLSEWIPTDEIIRSTNGTSVLLERSRDGAMLFYRVRKL